MTSVVPRMHPRLEIPVALAQLLADTATALIADQAKAFQLSRRKHVGATLRPGRETVLWNSLVEQVRPHLRKHGAQARLGRLLALDRQAVHAYFVSGQRMPDAERTLQILAWLIAVQRGGQPA